MGVRVRVKCRVRIRIGLATNNLSKGAYSVVPSRLRPNPTPGHGVAAGVVLNGARIRVDWRVARGVTRIIGRLPTHRRRHANACPERLRGT